ncbi:hypothetical protein TARUN_8829 [Trichoderma arundinaceum]|uniref:Uncharacterized protein n=1 Tax=Trichoderma arundinaceum TaxID=490622 RepID=A0A395NBD7_TRIAR|nr:hypothetical protein TARUN_8829 [Trichoderma arundinaceum]
MCQLHDLDPGIGDEIRRRYTPKCKCEPHSSTQVEKRLQTLAGPPCTPWRANAVEVPVISSAPWPSGSRLLRRTAWPIAHSPPSPWEPQRHGRLASAFAWTPPNRGSGDGLGCELGCELGCYKPIPNPIAVAEHPATEGYRLKHNRRYLRQALFPTLYEVLRTAFLNVPASQA